MARRGGAPEVNAGSMADIAFLLLIFFLVTTTIETDAGLDRMLPPIEPPDQEVIIKQKNIFTVQINKNGQLLVEDELTELKDLKEKGFELFPVNPNAEEIQHLKYLWCFRSTVINKLIYRSSKEIHSLLHFLQRNVHYRYFSLSSTSLALENQNAPNLRPVLSRVLPGQVFQF